MLIWKTRWLSRLAAIVTLGVGGLGHANPQMEKKVRLSWNDVRKAAENHPALRVESHKIAVAKSEEIAAGAVPNPELEASLGYGMAKDGSDSKLEWGIGLEIPLDWLGKRQARKMVARARVKAQEAEREALRLEVLLELRLLFWDLLYHQEQVLALEELATHSERFARTVQSRVDGGEVRPVESIQARLEVRKISGELVLAQAALKIRRKKLAMWLTIEESSEIQAIGAPHHLPTISQDGESYSEIVARHPDVLSLSSAILASAASLKMEKRERIPGLSLSPFYESELDKRAAGIGITIELPFWMHNKGNIAIARNERLLQEAERDRKLLELQSNLAELESVCEAGVEVATSYRDAILPEAQSVAKTIERTYQLGEASLFEVLSATHALLEIRLQFISAALKAHVACTGLAAMRGDDL